jgi:hypothetical protein
MAALLLYTVHVDSPFNNGQTNFHIFVDFVVPIMHQPLACSLWLITFFLQFETSTAYLQDTAEVKQVGKGIFRIFRLRH